MCKRSVFVLGCVVLVGLMSAPAFALPHQFYLLNVTGGNPWGGRIEGVSIDGTTRTQHLLGGGVWLDIEPPADPASPYPTPYSNINDWHGFATADAETFYVLNTQNLSWNGRIEKFTLPDMTRSTVFTLADALGDDFGDANDWQGLATDGKYFYLLNTNGSQPNLAKVFKVAMDGSSYEELFDLSPGIYNSIGDWHGFATDSQWFYVLNTNGGSHWTGRVERISMDGSTREALFDLSGSSNIPGGAMDLYGNMGVWQGFAIPAIPEPATLSLLGLGALGVLRRRRKR